MEYTLDQVIKTFKKLSKDFSAGSIEKAYYDMIVKYLLLENKHSSIVLQSGKPIYHYFKYHLPQPGSEYFRFLYNPYNPVRFAMETFSSIQEIHDELNK